MKNKKKRGINVILAICLPIFLASIFSLGFLSGKVIYDKNNQNENEVRGIERLSENQLAYGDLDIPSKCYTTLQSTNYFEELNNSILENKQEHYLKIVYGERNISVSQVLPTGSMRPSIPDYSRVMLVAPLSEQDIKIGDIISTIIDKQNASSPHLLHRVIGIATNINGEAVYITKGDNNIRNDMNYFNLTFNFSEVNGKVVGVLY